MRCMYCNDNPVVSVNCYCRDVTNGQGVIDEMKELMEAVIPPEWRALEWDRSFEEWREYLNSDPAPSP